MKLLLTVADQTQQKHLIEVLSSYRFKEDVSVVIPQNENYADIVSAAYAAILPDAYDSDFSTAVNVLSGATALIIPAESVYSELVPETFRYKLDDSEDITRVFLEAFRDERKRTDLISRSKDQLETLKDKDLLNTLRQLFSGSF